MDLSSVIILGIVEGITEFLPISSTGHLILTSKLLSLTDSEFLKTFQIVIQLGAILAVVVLYWRKLLINKEILKRVTVAFLPTAVIGLIFYKIIKTYLLSNALLVVYSLFIGGIILIIFEWWYKNNFKKKELIDDIEKISYKQSVLIGVFQSLAMIPGVSRSGATIIGGLGLGLSRVLIVEFSFLLAVPTMVAATGLDLIKNWNIFNSNQEILLLLIGFIVSFVVAIFSIKFLLSFIKKYDFSSFGLYRIIIAIIFWWLII